MTEVYKKEQELFWHWKLWQGLECEALKDCSKESEFYLTYSGNSLGILSRRGILYDSSLTFCAKNEF